MYNSVKDWINVPFQYKSFKKYSSTGTKIYNDTVNALCYPAGELKRVSDLNGVEVPSVCHLYVDGNEAISQNDTVIFEGHERSIVRISTYYRNGVPDVKVVYL